MGNIWTKWEKNLEHERGQIWTLYLPLPILRGKKFFHESCQIPLINSFTLPAQKKKKVSF